MEKKTISSIAIQKTENRCLVIEVPVASLPVSLRSGQVISKTMNALCVKAERECLFSKLERFLKRAHKAEENKNYCRAARAFVLALYCEGKLRPDVENPCPYVRQALPVY